MTTSAPPRTTVYVSTITHNFGTTLGVHANRAAAVAEVATFARYWWGDMLARPSAGDVDETPPARDDEVIDIYFTVMEGDERYSIDAAAVDFDVTAGGYTVSGSDSPTTEPRAALRAEYEAQKVREAQATNRIRRLAVPLLVDILDRRLPEVTRLLVRGDSEDDWWIVNWAPGTRSVDEIRSINEEIGDLPSDVGYDVWGEIGEPTTEERTAFSVDVARLRQHSEGLEC